MARTEPAETHTLTSNEINRLVGQYRGQRQVALDELIRHERRRAGGTPEAPPPTDQDKAIRSRARQLVNGYAAADWALPKDVTREQELRIEVSAIDMVIAALENRWTQQRAVESVEWEERELAGYRAGQRDWLFAKLRVRARREWLMTKRQERGPFDLPLASHTSPQSPLMADRDSAELDAAVREALALGIVTKRDLEAAADVK